MVASRTGEISTGRPMASASASTNTRLSDMPPSMRRAAMRVAAVVLGRLDEVGPPVGHALEDGPHHLGPS